MDIEMLLRKCAKEDDERILQEEGYRFFEERCLPMLQAWNFIQFWEKGGRRKLWQDFRARYSL